MAYQALQRGEGVVALARTPSKVTKPQGSCGEAAVTGLLPFLRAVRPFLTATPPAISRAALHCAAAMLTGLVADAEPLTDANLKVLAGSVTNQADVDAVFAEGSTPPVCAMQRLILR